MNDVKAALNRKWAELEKRFTWGHAALIGAIFLIFVIGTPVVQELRIATEDSRMLSDCKFAHKKPCKIVVHKTAVPQED